MNFERERERESNQKMQHWLKCTFTLASVSARIAWNVYGSLFLREEGEQRRKKGTEKRERKNQFGE